MASLLEPVYVGVLSNSRVDTFLDVASEKPTSTVTESYERAELLGSRTQPAGASTTADRWQVLVTISSNDLSAPRVVEPYLDALAILAKTGSPSSEPNADPFLLIQLGVIGAVLESARRVLSEASELGDTGLASGPDGRIFALRVRSTVAVACEEIIRRIGHAPSPAALTLDPTLSKRIADLELYLRQHLAERDEASLGGTLTRLGEMPW